jgi:hypothetical protein
VAASADRRQGPGVRQREAFASLEPPEKNPGLDSSRCREGRRPDLTMKPDQRLVLAVHTASISDLT